jgi:GAF domain-containing protein
MPATPILADPSQRCRGGPKSRTVLGRMITVEQLLRGLSRLVLAGRTPEEVLGEITDIARQGIPGTEATSITLVRGDKGVTAAYSGEMALAADELQYEEGYGPCLDAGRGNVVLRVDDMTTEQRWPDYSRRVLVQGVRSSLSVPLPYQGASIGALNNYSTRQRAFASPESLEAALEVAEVVAVAVANATAHAELGEQAHHMRVAMDSRAVIEQAKGVLMAQRRIDAEQAFDVLREASQRYNRKLRDIAAGIVASTQEGRR